MKPTSLLSVLFLIVALLAGILFLVWYLTVAPVSGGVRYTLVATTNIAAL